MLGALGRLLGAFSGLILLAVGGLGLASVRLPDAAAVGIGRELLALAVDAVGAAGLELDPARIEGLLAAPVPSLAVPLTGLVLLVGALWPRRKRGKARRSREQTGDSGEVQPLDRSMRKRVEKQASALVKQSRHEEAAELYLDAGLHDAAADTFIATEAFARAAEVRHDQNRFLESAELYVRAGNHESAGAIYATQSEWLQAAECYLKIGRRSLAAEMFEKAGALARAGECYEQAEFFRHAAQAFVRCQQWEKAARCLERVLQDECMTGGEIKRDEETRKLVLRAAKLFEQAGSLDKSESILERGGCLAAAAEIALRRERFSQAADLFLRAREPLRAADALRRFGEDKAASRVLAEHHRDQGDQEEAARFFEEAGDHGEAGDLYRKLEQFETAGACYERHGEPAQAGEMFALAESWARAGRCFERARRFARAAECYAQLGDRRREGDLREAAGEFLRAGEIFHESGHDDEAIKVLQRVEPQSPDFRRASGLLGEIFKAKGKYTLSIKKLRQAVGGSEPEPDNVDAMYTLACVYELNGDLRDAVDLYEKILAYDYHYADVEGRLERARTLLAESSETPTAASASSQTPMPATPGRYCILEELGRGGMGIVYKANDTVLDRLVAYKVLPDALKENTQALKNFLREAKSAARLNHPNIVTVYDAGEQDGRYYIAMEYVDGTTLKEILRRRGAISPGGVLHVLAQMCEALAYAHETKIVHRDIKTANTMWTRDKKAKIMDFGLAKVMEEVRNHTTLVSGTPYYMSPEQTLGRNVDHRTDIYSLGVTLFELATGRLPFQEGNVPYHHVHTPAPDPREINQQLPGALASIISRCLKKDPEDRYQTAREILGEVKAVLGRRRAASPA